MFWPYLGIVLEEFGTIPYPRWSKRLVRFNTFKLLDYVISTLTNGKGKLIRLSMEYWDSLSKGELVTLVFLDI